MPLAAATDSTPGIAETRDRIDSVHAANVSGEAAAGVGVRISVMKRLWGSNPQFAVLKRTKLPTSSPAATSRTVASASSVVARSSRAARFGDLVTLPVPSLSVSLTSTPALFHAGHTPETAVTI